MSVFNPSLYQLSQLNNMEFKPTPQLVPKVFPAVGTTLFAAREKTGKSLMMTDLCMAITHNGQFMGYPMEQGDALYIALEDNHKRFGYRAKELLGYEQFHGELVVAHEWGKIIESKPKDWEGLSINSLAPKDCVGGIAKWAQIVKTPKLVVIDTLNFVRQQIGKGQNPYQKDCNDVKALTDLANKAGIAIILVHHNNKQKDLDNPNDKISGTTGLPSAVDNVVVLYEVQGRQILSVKSRNMESGKYAVDFDPSTLKWSLNGSYEAPPKQNVAAKIVQHLSANGATAPKAISDAIGYDGNISVTLKKLVDKGQIQKRDGLYEIMEAA
jgi:RecA-family ATPase